jgi:hypothetical protein
MQHAQIIKAEAEAERFLEVIQNYHDRRATDKDFYSHSHIYGYRETGAIRRASMDLTRALAEMRKP